MPKFQPGSLSTDVVQPWRPSPSETTPPQPETQQQHVWLTADDGNLWHKYWDGHTWSAWENLGHPD